MVNHHGKPSENFGSKRDRNEKNHQHEGKSPERVSNEGQASRNHT
jgi:hypothetical protein